MVIIQVLAAFGTLLLSLIGFFLVRLVNSIDRNERQLEEFGKQMAVFIAQSNQIVASLEEVCKDHEARIRVIEKRLPTRKKVAAQTTEEPVNK
jgi:predicted aspartyl protease